MHQATAGPLVSAMAHPPRVRRLEPPDLAAMVELKAAVAAGLPEGFISDDGEWASAHVSANSCLGRKAALLKWWSISMSRIELYIPTMKPRMAMLPQYMIRQAAAKSTGTVPIARGLALTFWAALLAGPALAADTKTLSGSACQPSFFTAGQSLFRREPMLLSNSNLTEPITCPVVKDVDAGRIKRAQVRVINRNGTIGSSFFCKLSTYRPDGSFVQSQSRRSTLVSTAVQTLNFDAQKAAPGGSYSLICNLPAAFGPNRDLSAIVSYTVVEE